MNLNNESGYIAKSGAKVRFICWNSNTGGGNGEDDNWIVLVELQSPFYKCRIIAIFDIMNVAEIKTDLHEKIEHADSKQVKEIYGLVLNYLNGQESEDVWDTLSEYQKDRITKSLKQAEEGLGTSVEEAVKNIRDKYRLNG